MNTIRQKLDDIYSPWFTKIISVIIVFFGTYTVAGIGPLSPIAATSASAAAALFCLWNPGGAAIIYILTFVLSVMHINAGMAALVFFFTLAYCSFGYASVAIMIFTPALFLTAVPDGMYWGMFIAAMYFVYRTGDKLVSLIYPIYLTLLLITFGRFGTGSYLYPNGVNIVKTSATDYGTFLDSITLDADTMLISAHFSDILKLSVLVLLAGVIVWMIFKNKWMRKKIKNIDVCEAVMFFLSTIVIYLLDAAVGSTLGLMTETSLGILIISMLLSYIITRPFASDKVAETLITKRELRNRKDAALTFVSVKPKSDWNTAHVNDEIKSEIKKLDANSPIGVMVNHDTRTHAAHVTDLIARQYGANIIKIDHDVFHKLYGDTLKESFEKLIADAKAQAPCIICFNDAESFFYNVDDTSGEYVKRYHKIYTDAVSSINDGDSVAIVLITDCPDKIDTSLIEHGIIKKQLIYSCDENDIPKAPSETEIAENKKKIKKKTNRSAAIAILLFLLALGSMLYYLFIYQNQQYDITDISPVQTEEAGHIYTDEMYSESAADQVCDIMEGSDATFFYIEETGDGYYTVYQTDETTFNDHSAARKGTLLKKMCQSAESLFSWSYDDLPTLPFSDINGTNTVFNGHLAIGDCDSQIDASFDGLENFFDDHQLDLSNDGFSAVKLAYYADVDDDWESHYYYGIINGDVTTVNATGDVSSPGFLAPVGETENVSIDVCAVYDPASIDYWCEAFMIH